MPTISPLSLVRNHDVERSPPTEADARRAVLTATEAAVRAAEEWAAADGDARFRDVEEALRELVFAVARALIVLFLVMRERVVMERYPRGERVEAAGRVWRRAPAIARNLSTMFGVVRFWRTSGVSASMRMVR